MISIIICSRENTITQTLKDNIESSIGFDYELIIIDNSTNRYSIFEAYNLGIEKSNGAYLCFLHDDILIHTSGWGHIISRLFKENKSMGLLGVAGAKVKTKVPSAWWRCPESQKAIKIIQHSKHVPINNRDTGFTTNKIEEVVVIDGVFMVLRKNSLTFFNREMKGFHNYDLNISFECIKQGFGVFVTNEINIEHFSAGSINEDWVLSTYKIHEIYKNTLPLVIPKGFPIEVMEIINTKKYINECFRFEKYKLACLIWFGLFKKHPLLRYHIKFWLLLFKIVKR